jgi:hypothetical protein
MSRLLAPRTRNLFLGAAVVFGAALPASADPEDPDEMLYRAGPFDLSSYEETGETKLCLDSKAIEKFLVISEREFVFLTSDGVYLSETLKKCDVPPSPRARYDYYGRGARLCRNDTMWIREKYSAEPPVFCTIGRFKKLRRIGAQSD